MSIECHSTPPSLPDPTPNTSTAFSPDGATAYFADSPSREIWAFDYNTQQGRIQGATQRVFANIPEPGVRTSCRAVFCRA